MIPEQRQCFSRSLSTQPSTWLTLPSQWESFSPEGHVISVNHWIAFNVPVLPACRSKHQVRTSAIILVFHAWSNLIPLRSSTVSLSSQIPQDYFSQLLDILCVHMCGKEMGRETGRQETCIKVCHVVCLHGVQFSLFLSLMDPSQKRPLFHRYQHHWQEPALLQKQWLIIHNSFTSSLVTIFTFIKEVAVSKWNDKIVAKIIRNNKKSFQFKCVARFSLTV